MSVQRSRNNGFTLIEVIIAAGILTTGIVAVLQSIAFAGAVAGDCNQMAKAVLLAQDKLQSLEIEQQQNNIRGESRDAPPFHWDYAVKPVDKMPGLYQVVLDISWPRHGKEENTGFETYVRKTN